MAQGAQEKECTQGVEVGIGCAPHSRADDRRRQGRSGGRRPAGWSGNVSAHRCEAVEHAWAHLVDALRVQVLGGVPDLRKCVVRRGAGALWSMVGTRPGNLRANCAQAHGSRSVACVHGVLVRFANSPRRQAPCCPPAACARCASRRWAWRSSSSSLRARAYPFSNTHMEKG